MRRVAIEPRYPSQAGDARPRHLEPSRASNIQSRPAKPLPPQATYDGIEYCGWILRTDAGSWSVGRWVDGTHRRRWRDATWHGRLDQALRALLNRVICDEVADVESLEDLIRRYEKTTEAMVAALSCDRRVVL